MWPFVLVPMIARFIAGMVAWQHSTRVDQQMKREMWARQAEPSAALGSCAGSGRHGRGGHASANDAATADRAMTRGTARTSVQGATSRATGVVSDRRAAP